MLRSRTLIPSVALLAIATGCLGIGADPVPAMEHRGVAEERAHEWDEGAVLSTVVGVEGESETAFEAAGEETWNQTAIWEASSGDEEVGDGRVERWLYRFVDEAREGAFEVVVDKKGTIVHEGAMEAREGEVPIAAWGVDSDRAARSGLEANEALDAALEREGSGLFLWLVEDEARGTTFWMLAGAAGEGDPGEGGVSVVDARSGQVLSAHGRTGVSP